MINRNTSVSLALSAVALALAAAPAGATSAADAILSECASSGGVAAGHAPADLRAAAQAMPVDMAEYTDCAYQIEAALLRALGHPSKPRWTPQLSPETATDAPAPSRAASAPPAPADATTEPADPTPEPADPTPEPDEVVADVAGPDPVDASEATRPAARTIGTAAAAATIGGSLLALANPGLLLRRRLTLDE